MFAVFAEISFEMRLSNGSSPLKDDIFCMTDEVWFAGKRSSVFFLTISLELFNCASIGADLSRAELGEFFLTNSSMCLSLAKKRQISLLIMNHY